jgi:hypothetical protein
LVCTTKGMMNSLISTRNTFLNVPRSLRLAILPAALLGSTFALSQAPSNPVDYAALMNRGSASPLLAPATATSSVMVAANDLPEDPSARLYSSSASSSGIAADPTPQLAPQNATKAGPVAPLYAETISAGYKAQPWTQHQKFIAGVRDIYSPVSLLGDVVSAGYSHVTNGQPNYGTDKGAFGQRLGATFLRDASETFFYESVMASVLHEDPRYYVEGPRYNVVRRTLYAITRPIITRTDSGRTTINGALLSGYAGASALSYAYYPAINRNFSDTAATFGGSLAGAAIGDFVAEFTDDVLQALHMEKKR